MKNENMPKWKYQVMCFLHFIFTYHGFMYIFKKKEKIMKKRQETFHIEPNKELTSPSY